MKIHKRTLTASNLRFDIYFDHVKDDFGNEVKEYLVVSPKNTRANLVAGCAVLPIANNSVGLIRIYRPAIRDYSLEIPHGFIEEGETNECSAIRELLEETGISIVDSQITNLGLITPDSGVIEARMQLYIAKGCYVSRSPVRELGLVDFKFYPIKIFEDMIKKSIIQDSITISAWCRYRYLSE